MKDQHYREQRPVKVDKETHDLLKQLKREMSALEKRDLSMGEITKRALKSDEIVNRLILGSKERRAGMK